MDYLYTQLPLQQQLAVMLQQQIKDFAVSLSTGMKYSLAQNTTETIGLLVLSLHADSEPSGNAGVNTRLLLMESFFQHQANGFQPKWPLFVWFGSDPALH